MDFSQWKDLQEVEINPFIENYRKSLEEQLKAAQELAKQQRTNQQAAYMSNANRAGMLYSNFPARQKIAYDANTYYPTVEKAQQTYQTGLDTLRSNAIKVYNQIEDYKKSIADLNESYQ